jgi:hypothetical protein
MNRNTHATKYGILLAAMLGLANVEASATTVPAIVGTWDSRVTLHPCPDPSIVLASFRALNQFDRHGALVATSQVAQPPSLGKWEWLGGRRYRAAFRFQRFGAGGAFEGMTQVTRVIRLSADGDSFTGVVTTELYDLSDTLFASGCGTEVAARVY